MKKVFFGLAVAVVALSASAFTNATTTVSQAYITGFDEDTQLYTYTLSDPGSIICPTSNPLPCGITPITYSLSGGTVAASLVNNPSHTTIDTKRASY